MWRYPNNSGFENPKHLGAFTRLRTLLLISAVLLVAFIGTAIVTLNLSASTHIAEHRFGATALYEKHVEPKHGNSV